MLAQDFRLGVLYLFCVIIHVLFVFHKPNFSLFFFFHVKTPRASLGRGWLEVKNIYIVYMLCQGTGEQGNREQGNRGTGNREQGNREQGTGELGNKLQAAHTHQYARTLFKKNESNKM